MPAWIATCHASGGSWRSLPMEMISATFLRWSSFSLAAWAERGVAVHAHGPGLVGGLVLRHHLGDRGDARDRDGRDHHQAPDDQRALHRSTCS
jgi:hypothetical protein